MNKKKILLIAVALGLIVVIMIVNYMGALEDQYESHGERVPVIMAREYIPPYSVLTRGLVKIERIPRPFVQPQALSSLDQMVDERGNAVYTTVSPIMLEEQIMTTKLAAIGREAGLALSLPPGRRAVTVEVSSEDGVNMLVRPGNNVDLLGTFQYQVRKGNSRESKLNTTVILQNVLVVGVGSSVLGDHRAARQDTRGDRNLTLAVTPEQASLITFARQRGRLSFSLRSMGDSELVSDPPVVEYSTLFPDEGGEVIPITQENQMGSGSPVLDQIQLIQGLQQTIMEGMR